MSEIKVRLSLSVPGAQRVSWEEAQEHPNTSYDTSRIKVDWEDKNGERKQETLVVKTLKQRLIKQNIQITKEAYEAMIQDPPIEGKVRGWASMTRNQKLNSHFKLIAEHLGAVNFHFEVLDD